MIWNGSNYTARFWEKLRTTQSISVLFQNICIKIVKRVPQTDCVCFIFSRGNYIYLFVSKQITPTSYVGQRKHFCNIPRHECNSCEIFKASGIVEHTWIFRMSTTSLLSLFTIAYLNGQFNLVIIISSSNIIYHSIGVGHFINGSLNSTCFK